MIDPSSGATHPPANSPSPDAHLVLTHLSELPTLPAVAARLLQLTTDLDSDINELAKLLRGDQSVTAKLLSLANSASTGRSTPATTVEQAVVVLGYNTVRAVILTLKVFETLGHRPADRERGLERAEFWKHAIGVACASRRIAETAGLPGVAPEEAFVAGLLHDIGKVALDAVFPKAYARVVALANERHGDIADAEREVLGVNHTVAGRHLAERWRLPKQFQEVVWLHHLSPETLPPSISSADLIAVVQVADTLVREKRIGYSGNHILMEPSAAVAERLHTGEEALGDPGALINEVCKWSELLGLDSAAPEALYQQALSRANTELGYAHSALETQNSRLAAGARCFTAITEFNAELHPQSELADVVCAIVGAAATACQREAVGALGLREPPTLVDVAWRPRARERCRSATQVVGEEMADWLADPGDSLGALIVHAPRAIRNLFATALPQLGAGDGWFMPIVNAGRVAGGVFFLSESDERARLAEDADELRSLLASLGLAIGRANIHGEARRLSDDLAEQNRRLLQMHREVLRTRTLASIAELAAGAGHELNSPLAVISGRAQMLQQQIDDADTQRSLQLIVDKAHQCSRVVKELMGFAKPRPVEPAPADTTTLLTELRAHWLETTEVPASRIALDLAEALPPILVDRPQIEIAMRELLRNAMDATASNQGAITVEARPGVSPGIVEIIVRDTGCGMSRSVIGRALDPFYSHKPAGRGRGLGLPRAYRIIDAHGGRLWLESRENEGTKVHVLLPVAEADRTADPTPRAQLEPNR